MRNVALYRWYSRSGDLLYVGISRSIIARTFQHAALRPWWRSAASCAVVWYPDLAAARDAERSAIKAEHPLHNVRHTPLDLGRERTGPMIDGTKVRELRAARGLSQAALAKEAGTSRQTVNKVEQGGTQPIPSIISAIARVLGVEPADLDKPAAS